MDLEDQLASEWEAEQAALDSEAERLRLSRVPLRDRLRMLAHAETSCSFELVDGSAHTARIGAVGVDWIALDPADGGRRGLIVPLAALTSVAVAPSALVRSARPVLAPSAIAERMTFGFVLRDLVRRRAAVALQLVGGRSLTGTIDRAGTDHLDLALHDAGAPRRLDEVKGHRMVPFSAIAWVRPDGADG